MVAGDDEPGHFRKLPFVSFSSFRVERMCGVEMVVFDDYKVRPGEQEGSDLAAQMSEFELLDEEADKGKRATVGGRSAFLQHRDVVKTNKMWPARLLMKNAGAALLTANAARQLISFCISPNPADVLLYFASKSGDTDY